MEDKAKLRYGIMCSGKFFQKWKAKAIRQLENMNNVEAALLIVNREEADSTILDKIKRKIKPRSFLFQVYKKVFLNPPAKKKVDMSKILKGVPSIACKVKKEGNFSQYFTEEDMEKIDSYNLDFILRFGFGIIRGDIHKIPRYGVWSFHHDNEKNYRGGPPCFWEIYKGDDVTGAILQRLTDRLDGGIVLKKGFLKTIDYSYSKNINKAYMESAKWPAQVCTDILNGNAAYLKDSPTTTDAPVFHSPNNLQFFIFLSKLIKNLLNYFYRKAFFTGKWNVGIVNKPIHTFLEPDKEKEVKWLPESSDKNKFKADPFGVVKSDKITIAFEEYDYRDGKGWIAGTQISKNPNHLQSEPFLVKPFHLSYPYLIEYDSEIFCVPESYQANEIALYKAENFPKKWSKVKTLVEGIEGVDATLFQYQQQWWLTFTKRENSSLNLFIYWSKELTGPWKPHLNNPVKADIRSSRPAGTPFVHKKTLYRPAQDYSRTTEGNIIINKVITLTKDEFEEKPETYIETFPSYPDAVHTISAIGNKTLVDGRRDIFNLANFPRRAKRKLERIF